MDIEELSKENLKQLSQLMFEMWPESSFEDEHQSCKRLLDSGHETAFLIKVKDKYIAFIYLSLRTDFVEGARSYPIGYVEALYVQPVYRKHGIAQRLLEIGEQWAKKQGCAQYASDAELTNDASIRLHLNYGFSEANRVVSFIKELD